MSERPAPTTNSRLATAASWTLSACAVHCVVMPFVIGVLPLLGLGVIISAWFEWSLVGAAALLGGAALAVSYGRSHRSKKPAAFFVAGLSIVVSSQLILDHRSLLHAAAAIVGAGLMYVAAHLNHDCARHEHHG
jgi:hypothetical protein